MDRSLTVPKQPLIISLGIHFYLIILFISSGWLTSNGHDDDFEMLDVKELNSYLEKFYAEVRTAEGNPLSKSTFVCLRSGINRHLKNPPFKRNITIMNQPEFSSSNRMFVSVLKNMKSAGNDTSRHHHAISKMDLAKIRMATSFDLDSPKELREKIFFDIQFHFARRGQENLKSLTKTSFHLKTDDTGLEYFELSYNEKNKNHQNIETPQSKPRMYATGLDTCPVKSLKLYLSKLNTDSECLYTYEIRRKNFTPNTCQTWYTTKPLGIHGIGSMMKNISKRLQLSEMYTNHCIRATVVTLLSAEGIEARQIMRVTGHKSESSLRSYDSDNPAELKRKISNILAGSSPSSTTTSVSDGIESTVSRSIHQNRDLSETPSSSDNHNQEVEMNFQSNLLRTQFSILNNSNCTININFK